MVRFGEDPERFFAAVYEGSAPWDIGGPQPALVELLRDHPPEDTVLDLGSGSGDLSIWLASQGYRTLGIELIGAAVAIAQARAASVPEGRLEFRQGNALRPSSFGRTFGSVVDSGFYHLFEPDVCSRLVEEIGVVLRPGGRCYLLAFAVDLPAPHVPRSVTERELRERFSTERGWDVVAIRPAEFVGTVATVPAIAGCFRARETPTEFLHGPQRTP